jgi:hypothetical protein
MELRYHHALPGWCKVLGLDIRTVPELEGGGFMVREEQARQIVLFHKMLAEEQAKCRTLEVERDHLLGYIEQVEAYRAPPGRASALSGQTGLTPAAGAATPLPEERGNGTEAGGTPRHVRE